MKFFVFLKNWTLLLSILIGAAGHNVFPKAGFVVPYLLFCMLLLTFCRISPKEIKFRKTHWIFLCIQLIGGLGLYAICYPFNAVFGESMMMCVLAPTAAASAVVTMKLGGNGATNTTYVLLSSTMVSIVAPLIFPIIHPVPGHTAFIPSCWSILQRVVPVLIGPFVVAFLLKYVSPKTHKTFASWHEVSFYLWAVCLIFATAQTITAIKAEEGSNLLEIAMSIGACILCLSQFWLGKAIGRKYKDEISCGQSLGQKNVVLAMWIAQSYLSPLALAGLGSYIVWQNIFNSWQLWQKRYNEAKLLKDC